MKTLLTGILALFLLFPVLVSAAGHAAPRAPRQPCRWVTFEDGSKSLVRTTKDGWSRCTQAVTLRLALPAPGAKPVPFTVRKATAEHCTVDVFDNPTDKRPDQTLVAAVDACVDAMRKAGQVSR